MSGVRHRDPYCGVSAHREGLPTHVRRITPQPKTARVSGSLPRRNSESNAFGGSNLIVARGLYEVLENEVQGNARSSCARRRSTSKGLGSRPNFLFCYLCGRQFGSTSLQIHQPQCYVKKMIEWERMDPAKRGAKPLDPAMHEKQLKEQALLSSETTKSSGKMHIENVDRFNDFQMQHFNDNMLLKCENCGRTFLPDRLEVHQRSCKAGSSGASKPVSRFSKSVPPCGRVSAASVLSGSSKKTAEPAAKALSPDPGLRAHSVFTVDSSLGKVLASSSASPMSPSDALLPEEKDPLAKTRPGEISLSLPDTSALSYPALDTNADSPGKEVAELQTNESDTSPNECLLKPKSPVMRTSFTLSCSPGKSERCSANVTDVSRANSSVGQSRADIFSARTPKEKSLSVEPPAGSDTCEPEPRETPSHDHKIQLNNVSRFKHVQSRIKLERTKPPEELPRCRHCNRTFNRERLEKHESVCVDRHKLPPPPAAKAAAPAARQPRPEMTPRRKTAANAEETKKSEKISIKDNKTVKDVGESSGGKEEGKKTDSSLEKSGAVGEPVKLLFCFHCGTKLRPDGQRFCSACGTKLD